MDLAMSPQELELQDQVRTWIRENRPAVAPTSIAERRAWHRKLYEAGYIGMLWPREHGGRGSGPLAQAIVLSELAQADLPAGLNWAGLEIGGPAIFLHGSPAQKSRYLEPILQGEELWCQLYSEPGAGSDLASLRTRAVDQGDHFLVNGQKTWTSDGLDARFGLLLARTSGEADPTSSQKRSGISAFILDMQSPGVEVRPLRQITGHTDFCEVFLTDVRVPKERLVGSAGMGWKIANATFAYERGTSTLARISRYRRALQRLLAALQALTRAGRPLVEDAHIRQRVGTIYAEMEVQRYAALRLLSEMEQGRDPGAHASVVKLSCSEFERRLNDLAQELLGPWARLLDAQGNDFLAAGTSSGAPGTWAHSLMWSRAVTIFAGTSEIQRNIISDRLLNLPREPRPAQRQ